MDHDEIIGQLCPHRHCIHDAVVSVEDATNELLLIRRVWPHRGAIGGYLSVVSFQVLMIVYNRPLYISGFNAFGKTTMLWLAMS